MQDSPAPHRSNTMATMKYTTFAQMIAAAILVYFGARLCRRPDTRLKGVLMIVMAAVLVGNVLIATTL